VVTKTAGVRAGRFLEVSVNEVIGSAGRLEEERSDEQDYEHHEQYLGDTGRGRSDAGESEHAGDDGQYEKSESPRKHID